MARANDVVASGSQVWARGLSRDSAVAGRAGPRHETDLEADRDRVAEGQDRLETVVKFQEGIFEKLAPESFGVETAWLACGFRPATQAARRSLS